MKQRNLKAFCSNCPYWGYDGPKPFDEKDPEEETQTCDRFPPTVTNLENEEYPGYKWTAYYNVCGEHPDFFLSDFSEQDIQDHVRYIAEFLKAELTGRDYAISKRGQKP